MAYTDKYKKSTKSISEIVAENKLKKQYKKEKAEQVQQDQQSKSKIPILSDVWDAIGNIPLIGKWFSTLGDFSSSAFKGLSSSVEGVIDFGASAVGAFGDDSFKKKVQDFVSKDFTG